MTCQSISTSLFCFVIPYVAKILSISGKSLVLRPAFLHNLLPIRFSNFYRHNLFLARSQLLDIKSNIIGGTIFVSNNSSETATPLQKNICTNLSYTHTNPYNLSFLSCILLIFCCCVSPSLISLVMVFMDLHLNQELFLITILLL